MQAPYGGTGYGGGGYYPPPPYQQPTLEDWMGAYHGRVEKRRKHVNVLSVVLIIVGILYIVAGLGLGALFITAPAWDQNMSEQDKVTLPIAGVVFLVMFVLVGIWPAISAWGIRRRKEWGRWSAVIFCALTSPLACGSICCLPVTIWGIWALVGPEADGVFGHEPKPPPHLVPQDSLRRGKAVTPMDVRRVPGPAEPPPQAAPPTPAGYHEDAKPTGRTPIPHIYPRPRISSKTPPEGVYRYEPKKRGAVVTEEDISEAGGDSRSYSSIPTAKDIPKPPGDISGPDKEKK